MKLEKKLITKLVSDIQEAQDFSAKLDAINVEADTYKHDEVEEILGKAPISTDQRKLLIIIFKDMLSTAFRDGVLKGYALNKEKDE